MSVIASTVTSSLGRRKLFAQINSFIAVFILVGQLSLTVSFFLKMSIFLLAARLSFRVVFGPLLLITLEKS